MARIDLIAHRAALAALGVCVALYDGALLRAVWRAEPGAAALDQLPWAVVGVLLPLILLGPGLPRFAARPRGLAEAVAAPGAAGGLAALCSLVTVLRAARAGLDPALVAEHLAASGLCAVAALSAVVLTSGWTAMAPAGPAPARDPRPAPTPPPPPALPRMGVAMTLYVAADWLMLRLCGLGLLAMAWMIHAQADRSAEVASLLHGIGPRTVVGIYVAWGALLLVPAVLPDVLARPATVAGGAVKATVLLGLSLLFLPAIDVAIDLGPETARDALHAGVPALFKAVAGIAVLATMAVALFRHLGATAARTESGRATAPRASAADLRALRAARMEA